MPQDLAFAVQKRHGLVTVDTALHQRRRPGEEPRHPRRVMHQSAAHDVGARRPGAVILEVVRDVVALPEGEGADVRRGLGEFGDDRVVDVDSLGQMADQGSKELLAGAAGCPFDDRVQGAEVVAPRGGGRRPARAGRRLARFLKQRLGGAPSTGHDAPSGRGSCRRKLLGPGAPPEHVSSTQRQQCTQDYSIRPTKLGKTGPSQARRRGFRGAEQPWCISAKR